MKYLVGVKEDTDEVFLQFNEDDDPLGHMTFFAADAELLMHNIANARSILKEPVTPELDPSSRIAVMKNYPAWRVTNEHGVEGTTLFALRHEGYGWVGFLLDKERAHAISKALADFAPK